MMKKFLLLLLITLSFQYVTPQSNLIAANISVIDRISGYCNAKFGLQLKTSHLPKLTIHKMGPDVTDKMVRTVRKRIYNSIRIIPEEYPYPKEMTIYLHRYMDNAYYLHEPPSITVPFQLRVNGKTKHPKSTEPIVDHEWGHGVLELVLPIIAPKAFAAQKRWKNAMVEYEQRREALYTEIKALKDLLKKIKKAQNSSNEPNLILAIIKASRSEVETQSALLIPDYQSIISFIKELQGISEPKMKLELVNQKMQELEKRINEIPEEKLDEYEFLEWSYDVIQMIAEELPFLDAIPAGLINEALQELSYIKKELEHKYRSLSQLFEKLDKIPNAQGKIATIETQMEALDQALKKLKEQYKKVVENQPVLDQIIGPYHELLGDVYSVLSSGDKEAIKDGLDFVTSDKIKRLYYRFRDFSARVDVKGFKSDFTHHELAPVRSYVGKWLLDNNTPFNHNPKLVFKIIFEAVGKELDIRNQNPTLHRMSDEEMNRRLIAAIDKQIAILAPQWGIRLPYPPRERKILTNNIK